MRINFPITKQIVLSSLNIPFDIKRVNCQGANCKSGKLQELLIFRNSKTETRIVQKSISSLKNMAFKSYRNFIYANAFELKYTSLYIVFVCVNMCSSHLKCIGFIHIEIVQNWIFYENRIEFCMPCWMDFLIFKIF